METSAWIHVYPVKDLVEHRTNWNPLETGGPFLNPGKEAMCLCNFRVDWNDHIIIHESWDCREAVEQAEEMLKP